MCLYSAAALCPNYKRAHYAAPTVDLPSFVRGMASPATSGARTQPSVGVPQRKRYSPPAPSLETAATEGCDWSAYTKPELRALIESAAKILGGATRELQSRRPSFPDSLSPHLIMAWLPLGDIPYALRVSNAWRAASEPTFHAVAQRSGLARTFTLKHKATPWRETVRQAAGTMGWVASIPHVPGYELAELGGARNVTSREEGLHYFRGNGVRLWPGFRTSWRVTIDGESESDVEAFGLAVLNPTSGEPCIAYQWNFDNDYADQDRVPFPVVAEMVHARDGVFPDGDELEIRVTHNGGESITATLHGTDKRRLNLSISPFNYREHAPQGPSILGRDGSIVVAPWVDLAPASTATLGLIKGDIHKGRTWREHPIGKKTYYERRGEPLHENVRKFYAEKPDAVPPGEPGHRELPLSHRLSGERDGMPPGWVGGPPGLVDIFGAEHRQRVSILSVMDAFGTHY